MSNQLGRVSAAQKRQGLQAPSGFPYLVESRFLKSRWYVNARGEPAYPDAPHVIPRPAHRENPVSAPYRDTLNAHAGLTGLQTTSSRPESLPQNAADEIGHFLLTGHAHHSGPALPARAQAHRTGHLRLCSNRARKAQMAGRGRAEATPFFERLCPATTKSESLSDDGKSIGNARGFFGQVLRSALARASKDKTEGASVIDSPSDTNRSARTRAR